MSPEARASIAATLVFAGAVALIAADAPLWCVAIGLASAAWRIWVITQRVPRPKARTGMRFALGAITAILVIAVAMDFRTLNGLAAGTALLVVMGALKIFEARSRRDDGIVIGVALFLLLAAALAGQSLWRMPFYLLMLWATGAAIALVAHHGGALSPRAALRLSARTLAMSVPLAIACFVFFPRVAGQFWALQRGEQAATGLSDEMAPGSIRELATEYTPAFRVRFQDAPPPRAALYFRGPVLNSFDGFTWRRVRLDETAPTLQFVGAPIRYRVTLEPTNQPWMFALDTIESSPGHDVYMSHDRQLRAADPITSVVSYDAVSYLVTHTRSSLSAKARREETFLTEDRNPRARALALQIRARTGSDAEFARAVLEWFRNDGLEYTLAPGATSVDSVDTTLFDSKLGFCGHFASAYAMMMRAAGVPARVVTGYLGGEWNPAGGYLIVRQSDAHAWTEVWIEAQGWVRVDPTAVVAPERLQRGVFDMLAESLPASSVFLHNSVWLNRLSQLWDGAGQWWQDHVVEFNLRAQLNLLEKLGIDAPDWQHLAWGLGLGLVSWITWVSLSLRRSVARRKPDRIGRAWLRATRKLARIAAPRAASEGPLDYARRVGALRPELAASVGELATRYARLRFGPAANHDEIAAFERAVRRMGSDPPRSEHG